MNAAVSCALLEAVKYSTKLGKGLWGRALLLNACVQFVQNLQEKAPPPGTLTPDLLNPVHGD